MIELKRCSEEHRLRYVLQQIAEFPLVGHAALAMQLMAKGALAIDAEPPMMKSTQAMRDCCRDLSNPERDDYDRAVVCVIDDLEMLLRRPCG